MTYYFELFPGRCEIALGMLVLYAMLRLLIDFPLGVVLFVCLFCLPLGFGSLVLFIFIFLSWRPLCSEKNISN